MIGVDPIDLYEFFESRNIECFFHANTVRTSCTFIEQNGLLSRECVEYKGLVQTSQTSDDADRFFNVWDDIFVDVVDLHGYFPRQNFYGPVCFVIDNSFLLDKNLPNICITKDNPVNWRKTIPEKNRYYDSVQEYADEFDNNLRGKKIHSKMLTIRGTHKKIPFDKYLLKISLDNPLVDLNGINLYGEARGNIFSALKKAGLSKSLLETRTCSNCFCHDNYLNKVEPEDLEKLFL